LPSDRARALPNEQDQNERGGQVKDEKAIKSEIERLLKELREIDIDKENDEWVFRNGWLTALRWALDGEDDDL
jgi:hypothetical protein